MLRDVRQAQGERLQILEPLGSGGFGSVYLALDTRSGERVAVKELEDTSAESIARFKHEFRALADCHHPNLVGLRELIEQDGRWLIVMELVPGIDFLRYVEAPANDNRPAATRTLWDEAKLRSALIGIVEGLRALHQFGLVHRDLKPSNVRVRPDGRAVLLDFGLATSVDPKQQSTHALGVGTAVYMAPEQASGERVSPAADLYALGVCMFEALTGRAPFEADNAITVVLDKQRMSAPRASSLAAGVPGDLDELCARLLATEPSARPKTEEVLAALSDGADAPITLTRLNLTAEVFAGREAELNHLEHALARTHESELRVVLIEGESGVGKSELVSEFLRGAHASKPSLIALRGRCYENEQLSYNAFDGCIDALMRLLRRLDDSACRALLPERVALLAQLFPVLRNVKSIANASREGVSADPSARRLQAFAALVHLLAKLAEEQPLVLVLDDLQWADAESFRLLAALIQSKPAPPLLIVGTVRPRSELEPQVRERLDELRKWQQTDVIAVRGLPLPQARRLAEQLLPRETPGALLALIAEQSQGHPLFLSELVQYTQSHDFAARGELTLEAALSARIERLPRDARELLELAAVAGRPVPARVFATALGREIQESARSLLAAKLLRQRRGHELGYFHDRIRHAALALVVKGRLAGLHYKLALALEASPHCDPAELAPHWQLAGEPQRAADAFETAAQRAMAALAFAQAADLSERAIALCPQEAREKLQRLTVLRAEALGCAGFSAEAAAHYDEAARTSQGDVGITLRSKAAMHKLLSGQFATGMEDARRLVVELGYALPRGLGGTLLRFYWELLMLKLWGAPKARPERPVSAQERLGFALVFDLVLVIGLLNPTAFKLLLVQLLRRATDDARSNAEIGWAWLSLLAGKPREAIRYVEQALAQLGDDHDAKHRALHSYSAGTVLGLAHDWTRSVTLLERAHELTQEHCPDAPWLLTIVRHSLGANWFYTGQHQRLARETKRWLAEARERNDILAEALLLGVAFGYHGRLMEDQPELASRELEQSTASIASAPYCFTRLGLFCGDLRCALYRGGGAALAALNEHEETHKDEPFLRDGSVQHLLRVLRMRALLAALVTAAAGERAGLLSQLTRALRRFDRRRPATYAHMGALTRAQLAALEGRGEAALCLAREALSLHTQSPDGLSATNYLVGLLEGEQGAARCALALAALREQGWREPLRAIAMHVPTIEPLLARYGAQLVASAPNPKLLLDRYELTGELGRGGFGTVVAARDVRTGQPIALKELVRHGGASLERFKQEFRLLADLQHENIVQLEALFEHEGRWYIAMELVEGTDLLSYACSLTGVDAERLVRTVLGLLRGLGALHQIGFVHRDIKPENVLVTRDGRPVLLDFGLSARAGDAHAGAAGSAQYAAPEQLRGDVPDTAADIYGVGACLYHALLGMPPSGSQAASSAAFALDGLPGELQALGSLCRRMLAEDPRQRPSLAESSALLAPAQAAAYVERERDARAAALLGRERELARLLDSFDRAERSGLTIALVVGESGLGKSRLVDAFTARALAASPDLWLARSRCYENEQVAFKAFDEAIDQLAHLMRALSDAECSTLLPKRAALLAQLFPVLATVRAIGAAPKKGLPADPAQRRRAGCECLVQLLVNLGGRAPLVITMDDLQWSDGESFELLSALIARRSELRLLIVATVRPESELEPELRAQLSSLRACEATDSVELVALSESTARELLRGMLGAASDDRMSDLVRESKGHPLFLRELAAQERRGLQRPRSELTLTSALAARIAELPREARELLGLLALADKPYALRVYARALGVSTLPRTTLFALTQSELVERRADKLTYHHDTIRQAALGRLSPAERTAACRALAQALASEPRSDAAERARLWDEAGETSAAVQAYEQAGSEALSGLAFARAAQHFARALELLGEAERDPAWLRLSVAHGQALVRLGRSAEAAETFTRAAARAEGDEAIRLRMWAAQHLMQSAQVAPGLRAAEQLFAGLGLSLPRDEASAKTTILWERARLKLRGLTLRSRKREFQPQLLEAMHGLLLPVMASSMLPGYALIMQYLRRALDSGDTAHGARALSYEAFWRSINDPAVSQEQLFERAQSMAERSSDPTLIATNELLHGIALLPSPNAARAHLWRAHDLLQQECPGEPWLLTMTRMYLGMSWYNTGAFRHLKQHMVPWLDEARGRDDRYASVALSGTGSASLRHVMNGDPEAAVREIEEVMAPWPAEPFSAHHLGALVGTAQAITAQGAGPRLLGYLDGRARELDGSFLMRTPGAHGLRAIIATRALLLAIGDGRHAAAPALARRLQRSRRAVIGSIREGKAWVPAIDASLCLLEGDREGALAKLQEALKVAGSEARSTPGIEYLIGCLEGGDGGRERTARVRERLSAEGFVDLDQALRIIAPGSLELFRR